MRMCPEGLAGGGGDAMPLVRRDFNGQFNFNCQFNFNFQDKRHFQGLKP